MYGAVLWSDRSNSRALIWCEDHGNLAFFDGKSNQIAESFEFEEGDLVTFEVRDGCGMRLALEVEVISSEEYPFLANDLRKATQDDATQPVAQTCSKDGKIVPFKQNATMPASQDRVASPTERKICAI